MNDETTQHIQQPQPVPKSGRRKLVAIIAAIIALAALYYLLPLVVVVFVVQPVKVEGTAMAPTLNNGDRIFISKQVGTLNRGDIVVFWYAEDTSKSFIKRVIGLPGERIGIDDVGNGFQEIALTGAFAGASSRPTYLDI